MTPIRAWRFPSLIRLLIDQEGLSGKWRSAITYRCMAYTNHTVMAEALERWPVDMMKQDASPHLHDSGGAQPPPVRRAVHQLPRPVGAHRPYGHHRLWPGAHGQPLRSHVLQRQRRQPTARQDPAGQSVPRLLAAQQVQVLRHHQRHYPPPLAGGSQPRADLPAQGSHRSRLCGRRLQALRSSPLCRRPPRFREKVRSRQADQQAAPAKAG